MNIGRLPGEYEASCLNRAYHTQADFPRHLSASSYRYLINLPLILHLPSLHSFVVHAGLLPHDPLKALEDPSQPLLLADTTLNTSTTDLSSSRSSEELSIIRDVPQNTVPWNLINMRSVRTKGKKKGQPTKSSKKGTPWSKLWKKQMARCRGPGAWSAEDLVTEEWEDDDDVEVEDQDDLETRFVPRDDDDNEDDDEDDDNEDDLDESSMKCSPVTVIYGHAGKSLSPHDRQSMLTFAAGRGLDIKPFSKGIDTGCVVSTDPILAPVLEVEIDQMQYGKKLTALILGDRGDLKGKSVRLGDEHGILVSESCKKRGY